MNTFFNFLTLIDKRLQAFIFCFITADIAIVIVASMVVWVLFQRLGAQYFSVITIITLLITSITTKKYSYLLDQYSRIKAMLLCNILLILFMLVTLLTDWVWLYALLFFSVQGYFSVFYPARSAVAQALITEKETSRKETLTFKQLVSVLVITDKFGSILAAMIVAGLFSLIGIAWLIIIGIITLGVSTVLFINFKEPETTKATEATKKTDKTSQAKSERKGYAWFFSHPLAWLLTLAIFVHIVVMLSNTIRPIYFYDVLKLSPEMLEYTSIAFNIGALSAGVLVNFVHSERLVIYGCFGLGIVTAWAMALIPIFTMFVICSGVLGFATSSNRVMFSSLIMQNVDNSEIATFFGMQSSLIKGMQFIGLVGINALLFVSTPDNVIWFYPAVFLFVPVLWGLSKIIVSPLHHQTIVNETIMDPVINTKNTTVLAKTKGEKSP